MTALLITLWALYFLGAYGTYWLVRVAMSLGDPETQHSAYAYFLIAALWPLASAGLAGYMIFHTAKDAWHDR